MTAAEKAYVLLGRNWMEEVKKGTMVSHRAGARNEDEQVSSPRIIAEKEQESNEMP